MAGISALSDSRLSADIADVAALDDRSTGNSR